MNTKPVVIKDNEVWVLRLEQENGKKQEYRCASEAQAKNLAMVLAPQPK